MSLLADLFAGKALDPGYAEAAARRADRARSTGDGAGEGTANSASRPHEVPRHAGFVAVLVVAGLLLAVAGQEVRRSEPVAQKERARLVGEIRARTSETDALQRRLEGLRVETERLRAAALTRSEAGRRTRGELGRVAAAAAATPASGGALVVTLDDAPGGTDGDDGSPTGRVYDQDLQILVNGLWAAGATAIGINGQRLTSMTAIRSAGEAILVDYRPLSPPYEVTALGDRDRLSAAFGDSSADRHLRALEDQFGIRVGVRTKRSARLPAAGALRLRYAREETSG
jgi:uncharacterized protein YlxW (UPF0749 family)